MRAVHGPPASPGCRIDPGLARFIAHVDHDQDALLGGRPGPGEDVVGAALQAFEAARPERGGRGAATEQAPIRGEHGSGIGGLAGDVAAVGIVLSGSHGRPGGEAVTVRRGRPGHRRPTLVAVPPREVRVDEGAARRRIDDLVVADRDIAQPDLLAVVQERGSAQGQQDQGGGPGDAVGIGDPGRRREPRRLARLVVIGQDVRDPAVRAEHALPIVDRRPIRRRRPRRGQQPPIEHEMPRLRASRAACSQSLANSSPTDIRPGTSSTIARNRPISSGRSGASRS